MTFSVREIAGVLHAVVPATEREVTGWSVIPERSRAEIFLSSR